MLTYNSLLESELKKLIYEHIQRATEQITSPVGVKDFAEYKQTVGKIMGLQLAVELAEEAHRLVQTKE
jgi:hypothetical protein